MWMTQKYDEALYALGIDGGAAEIGVLGGAFILALHQLMPESACSLAIDCFDLPDYELELPGERASLPEYLANVRRCVDHPLRACCFVADSGTIEPDEFARRFGRVYKFFAVDGLHTEERTLHDLHIAAAALVDGGMIILDDWKPGCPAVVDAARTFVAEGRFVPVSCGFNKLWLARATWAYAYRWCRLHRRTDPVEVYGHAVYQLGPTDPYNPGDWYDGV